MDVLEIVRAAAHRAAQHLGRAARANLPATQDDSHTSLAWVPDSQRLKTHRMMGVCVELSFSPLVLFVVDREGLQHAFHLAGAREADCVIWLDAKLSQLGLEGTSGIELPYQLPLATAAVDNYPDASLDSDLRRLSVWYDIAHSSITQFCTTIEALNPGPVRCWPHHFDIASYIKLERGDQETARGIGIGLSPGDESYSAPYFYINPWPAPPVEKLQSPVANSHWHTEGFSGLIAKSDLLMSTPSPNESIQQFIEDGFAAAKETIFDK